MTTVQATIWGWPSRGRGFRVLEAMPYLKRAKCFDRIDPGGVHSCDTRPARATPQPAEITFERGLFPDGNRFYGAIGEIANPSDQLQALRFGLCIEPKADAL